MKLNFNNDQILMAGNYVLALIGSMLLAWGASSDDVNFATGLFAIIASFCLAVWMNHANVSDIILSVARRMVFILGAYGVAKGWVSETMAHQIVNGILAVLPVLLAFWHYGDAPGPNLDGTTIVDPPLLLPKSSQLDPTFGQIKNTGTIAPTALRARDSAPLP